MPDPNVFLGQQTIEEAAKELDGVRKKAIQGEENGMFAAVTGNGQGQSEGVMSGTVKTPVALCSL